MTTTNAALRDWVDEVARLTTPEHIHWCDGSDQERDRLIAQMLDDGSLLRLNERTHPNCYLQPEHARAEILTRQTERFGRPFNYDWFAVALTGESQARALPASAEDDDPFPPDL